VNREFVIIWDLANPDNVVRFEQWRGVQSVSVSPDGTTIALADIAKLSIWRLMHTPDPLPEATTQHTKVVSCIAISPDSTFLTSGSHDSTVKLWDFTTGVCLHTFEDRPHSVECIAVSPNSSLIASGFDDSTISVWRVADHTLVHTFVRDPPTISPPVAAFAPSALPQITRPPESHFLWIVSESPPFLVVIRSGCGISKGKRCLASWRISDSTPICLGFVSQTTELALLCTTPRSRGFGDGCLVWYPPL
jgi:WD40 repeat protein